MSRFMPLNLIIAALALSGCASQVMPSDTSTATNAASVTANECIGSVLLPPELASQFVAIDDPELLNSALGQSEQGKLCQGQVYLAQQNVTLFRAWNSTNPKSRLGQWWAFTRPAGSIADYRSQYEICYQWSPLDKMLSCELKAGSKVVVGNGQSAKCSDYLTYPVSATQQVYLADAANSVANCTDFIGVMSWEAQAPNMPNSAH
ncbi:hypothetical protein ACFOEE_03760 [Pseudoalteromonas fenneropenaei]|uniref:Lipoprotein n=1 Tax=Pseudoalteromonas fenneropenaei TaxID=1737459 RepID=A0ABV7CGH1_9GAMM